MHGIKYFFLNKNNQTIQGGQKKFPGRGTCRKHYRKALFFKIQGGHVPPPWILLDPPLTRHSHPVKYYSTEVKWATLFWSELFISQLISPALYKYICDWNFIFTCPLHPAEYLQRIWILQTEFYILTYNKIWCMIGFLNIKWLKQNLNYFS
jgi:hypothetical protein